MINSFLTNAGNASKLSQVKLVKLFFHCCHICYWACVSLELAHTVRVMCRHYFYPSRTCRSCYLFRREWSPVILWIKSGFFNYVKMMAWLPTETAIRWAPSPIFILGIFLVGGRGLQAEKVAPTVENTTPVVSFSTIIAFPLPVIGLKVLRFCNSLFERSRFFLNSNDLTVTGQRLY